MQKITKESIFLLGTNEYEQFNESVAKTRDVTESFTNLRTHCDEHIEHLKFVVEANKIQMQVIEKCKNIYDF